ncbi:MAG: hypothetical protein ACJAS1_001614 [Oleiphilaceae bacterium]|jgi:hypothetical protein
MSNPESMTMEELKSATDQARMKFREEPDVVEQFIKGNYLDSFVDFYLLESAYQERLKCSASSKRVA